MKSVKITAKKNFDLNKIKLDVSKELNLIGDMIRKDIRMGIKAQRTIDGKVMKPLHPFTVKEKGFPAPLIKEGIMSRINVKKATKKKQEVKIYPAKQRTQPIKGFPLGIAEIQQKGARIRVTDNMRAYLHGRGLHLSKKTQSLEIPARPWFGISDKIMRDIPRMIKARIRQEIRRARF